MFDIREFDKWIKDYDKIVELYHNETDRAAAVLAGSVLEKYLGDHIRAFLIDDSSIEDLFRGYGPISSFSAKINIACALGLLTETMRNDCNHIRRIRNHFAHHPADTSFDISPVRDYCTNLSTAKPVLTSDGNRLIEDKPRIHYLLAVGITIASLHMIMLRQQRREIPVYGSIASDSSAERKD